MWKVTLIFIVRFGGGVLVSYATPKILIGLGVPLDKWIDGFITQFKNPPTWINYDSIYWSMVAVFGVFIISLTYFMPYIFSRRKRDSKQKEDEVQTHKAPSPLATRNVRIDPTKPIESPTTKAVERDVWLLYAVHYIAYGSWTFIENPLDEDHLTAGHQALDEIRQKAFDKDLPVWGRIGQGPLFKQIQKEHWEDHSFKSLSFIVNKPEEFCTKYYGNESDYTIYNSLMTSKAKVEELWPTTKHLTHDQPTFNATRQELNKLCLAVVAVRTKVLNHESFDACKDKLTENCIYLKEHEAVFVGSRYAQEYRDFMHSAGMAIDLCKQYSDIEERKYVIDLMLESSKKLEEALK